MCGLGFGVFDNAADAKAYVNAQYDAGHELVVKADGLAAGKGVIVSKDRADALSAVDACFSGAFGAAGARVVLEELLVGEEASIFALVDGNTTKKYGFGNNIEILGQALGEAANKGLVVGDIVGNTRESQDIS